MPNEFFDGDQPPMATEYLQSEPPAASPCTIGDYMKFLAQCQAEVPAGIDDADTFFETHVCEDDSDVVDTSIGYRRPLNAEERANWEQSVVRKSAQRTRQMALIQAVMRYVVAPDTLPSAAQLEQVRQVDTVILTLRRLDGTTIWVDNVPAPRISEILQHLKPGQTEVIIPNAKSLRDAGEQPLVAIGLPNGGGIKFTWGDASRTATDVAEQLAKLTTGRYSALLNWAWMATDAPAEPTWPDFATPPSSTTS